MNDPTLRRLALGTLLPAFAGRYPPAWASRLVERGLAGFALFGYNIADPAQVAALTAALRAARPDVIVATDEEGGDVTRLRYAEGSPYPGNAALGVVDDVELTRLIYRAIGAELASAGITLDMAPAVDVNSAEDNPAIGTRSFGTDPALVARHGAAAVAGLREAGIAACAKHFPGHGATAEDSHLGLPVVDVPLTTLAVRELPPFVAAIGAGVPAIMTAHIRVPVLTGDAPATFSRPALAGLLRTDLGFTGAIVSDALEMSGASGAIGIPEAAVRALVAGNDLLCFGGELAKGPHNEAVIEATATAIVAAVRDGRLGASELELAVTRNAVLAGAGAALVGAEAVAEAGVTGTGPDLIGAAHQTGDPLAGLRGPGLGGPGLGGPVLGGPGLGLAAARRALRIEGTLPGSLAQSLIIQLEPAATLAVGEVPWGLSPYVADVFSVRPTDADAIVLGNRAGGRPIIVVSRDTHRHPWARALVERLSAGHPEVVLVEMGWPAAWRPAGVRAYVATYGAARANARAAAEVLAVAL